MSGTRLRFAVIVATTVAALALAMPAPALAIQRLEGSTVTVARGETIVDDVYAFGNTIRIDGTVDGDVVAFGQIVEINGDVSGSVFSGAQSVRVDGTVGGSVRAGAAMVDVGGRVEGDVLAGAGQVTISGDVGRDLAAGAQTVSITGSVGRDVMVGADSLTIAGDVGGDVQAEANNVTVAPQGSVQGDLDYWSADEADLQGDVSGTATRYEPPTDARREPQGGGLARSILAAMLAWVQSLIGFLILGLFAVLLAHKPMHDSSQVAIDRVWPSIGVGLLVFFGGPMAAGFVFFIGLFIGAWWLAFVLLMVYWLLLLLGVVVGSLAIGRALLRNATSAGEPALAWSVILGLVLVWLVAAVPLLGWLAGWAAMSAGTGAIVLLVMGKGAKPVASPIATPVAVAEPQPPVAPAPVQPQPEAPPQPVTPPPTPPEPPAGA